MREEKYFCDHCGKEITDDNDYCDKEIDVCSAYIPSVDLCLDCYEELGLIVERFCLHGKNYVDVGLKQ